MPSDKPRHRACEEVPSCICNRCKNDLRTTMTPCCCTKVHRGRPCPTRTCAGFEPEASPASTD